MRYLSGGEIDLPNVSICNDEINIVHFNRLPDVPQIPNNEIWYEASAKLVETTTSEYSSGLHTNAFNTTIQSHTFENGKGQIVFDNEVTNIGALAFFSLIDLTAITIPNSVTSIGEHAFWFCINLTSIIIPNSVISIGEYAFSNCNCITTITIHNNITQLGNFIFSSLYPALSTVIFEGTKDQFLTIAPQDGTLDGLFSGQPVEYIECSDGNIDASPYKQSCC